MKKLVLALTALLWLSGALLTNAPVSAQMNRPPGSGDYDSGRQWRDASWWWTNHPDWVRQHHPTWWGEFDQSRTWRPASWWWQNNPDWVRRHHPEWWGDWDRDHVWQPANWWYQQNPSWIYQHHPEWWGAPYEGQWYPAALVGAELPAVGADVSSRMVGRGEPGTVVSRVMVVRPIIPTTSRPTTRNGGATRTIKAFGSRRAGGRWNNAAS